MKEKEIKKKRKKRQKLFNCCVWINDIRLILVLLCDSRVCSQFVLLFKVNWITSIIKGRTSWRQKDRNIAKGYSYIELIELIVKNSWIAAHVFFFYFRFLFGEKSHSFKIINKSLLLLSQWNWILSLIIIGKTFDTKWWTNIHFELW